MSRRSLVRIIDANANRAMEGLRVCGELVRFHLEVPKAFRRLRALRHATARAVQQLPVSPAERLRARQSERDFGKHAPSTSVDSLERLLVINFQRAKEALRTLEECSRLIAPRHVRAFQHLRFQTYGVERETILRVAALRHS